jgi:hypothetical protein
MKVWGSQHSVNVSTGASSLHAETQLCSACLALPDWGGYMINGVLSLDKLCCST